MATKSDHRTAESERVGVVDVGGSHATATVVAGRLDRPSMAALQTSPVAAGASADELLDAIARPAQRAVTGDASLAAIPWVVAMPGPFDYEAGVGDFSGVGKFGSLLGVDVRHGLARRLKIAEHDLHFLNDAEAYGLGEWAYGARQRVDRLVCVTLGTGVGSAFVDRGFIVRDGEQVPPHGWAHLLTWGGRPIEDTASTRALARAFETRTGANASVKDIAARAAGGDPDAAHVLHEAMHALGCVLSPWLVSFGAQRLVVGGSIARSWSVIEPSLAGGIRHAGTLPREADVRASTLLDRAPLLGAAYWLRR